MKQVNLAVYQFVLAFVLCVTLVAKVRGEEDYSRQLPRIMPTSPEDSLSKFTVADGFEVQLVAAEPLISSPVALQWDAHGRMYVCEMRGYSENREDAISRITRIEDTDADGVYDKSIVYVDGLLWPTGIFPFDDGLFVGDAPNLYYFKDTDGDGRADTKQVVLTGFGTSNVQGLFNSFRWGLDNQIHIACSSVGGNIRRAGDKEGTAVDIRGRDISFDPRTFEFRPTSGGAQHGMCFDDWGRKFLSSNSDHIQQVMYEDHYIARNPAMIAPRARISIAADGPQAEVFRTSQVEPWRILRTRLRVSGEVPGIVEGGGRAAGYFTGATGVTIFRGDAWPMQHRGVALIGDVGGNLVHRKRLVLNGIELSAQRIDDKSELLSSSDIWFRPAQFANAPDGNLYVIDVYREVIEHPKSLPPALKQHLDLTAGRDRGRIYRIAPSDFQRRYTPMLADRQTLELVDFLDHRNAWHRETTARLLYQRQDKTAVPVLRQLADHSPSPLTRMHALYVLDGLGELDEATVLRRLADDHPQVRRHAIRLSESLSSSESVRRQWTRLADDDSMEVRYQLAFSAGTLNAIDRIPILATLIRRDTQSTWMQLAVQSSLSQGADELFATLVADPGFRSESAGEFLRKIANQLRRDNQHDTMRNAVVAASNLPVSESQFALPILGELLRSEPSNKRTIESIPDVELKRVRELLTRMVDEAAKIAIDGSVELQSRVKATSALQYASLEQVDGALNSLVADDHPEPIQRVAIATMGKFRSPQFAETLIDAWPRCSPGLREVASEVLFARPERTLALFDAIDAGHIAIRDIAKSRIQIAEKSKSESIRSRAQRYLESLGGKPRQEVVDNYADALRLDGNADGGRIVFRKHCSVCHKTEGFGHEIGPNLTSMKTRGAESILVNVLDPNREVHPQYLGYLVLTEDGRTLTGMISGEGATSITLRRAESATDEVLRSDIERIQSSGVSIMPEGLEEVINHEAMSDLIRYLMTVQ